MVELLNSLNAFSTLEASFPRKVEQRIKKAKRFLIQLRRTWRLKQFRRQGSREFLKWMQSHCSWMEPNLESYKKCSNEVQNLTDNCLRRIRSMCWPQRVTNLSTGLDGWIHHAKKIRLVTVYEGMKTSVNRCEEWDPLGRKMTGRSKVTWRKTIEREIKRGDKIWGEMKSRVRTRENRVGVDIFFYDHTSPPKE